MASRLSLDPTAGIPLGTNGAPFIIVNDIPTIRFDASTQQTVRWFFRAPSQLSGTLHLKLQLIMATATSGKVDMEARVMAVTPADALDLDSATSFDTVNTSTAPTVPATAGYLLEIDITLTNVDSIAVGDWVCVEVRRDAADGTNDTATGYAHLLNAELSDAA